MAFEIHSREFFEPEDDNRPSGQSGWRVLSIVVVAAILFGLIVLFSGSSGESTAPAQPLSPPDGRVSVALAAS